MRCEILKSYDNLIKKCIAVRKEKGLTVHQVADYIGTNSRQINNIENGKPVMSRTFLRYLEFLEINTINDNDKGDGYNERSN